MISLFEAVSFAKLRRESDGESIFAHRSKADV